MKLGHAIIGFAFVGLLQVSFVRADIPPAPRDTPEGKRTTSLEVKVDADKDVSFLRISREALREAGIEVSGTTKKTGAWTPSTERSIVAALAMSLGIAGVFLARKKRGAAIAAALVATTVVGAVGIHAGANAAPPPTDPNAVSPARNFHGQVVIELVDDGGVSLSIGKKPLPRYQRVLPPGSAPPSPQEPPKGN